MLWPLIFLASFSMAKDLTGTTALTEKDNAWYRIAWLAEIDADAPGVPVTTKRHGSRKITVGANTYGDNLAVGGLEMEWTRIRVGGGLASVGKARLVLVNLEKVSNDVDTFFFENDEMRIYLLFVTGAETASDPIEMMRLVIEDYPYSPTQMTFDAIDGSDKDFREIPAERVNLIDYVQPPMDSVGKVIPVAFGVLNTGPFDGAGGFSVLAPCRCVDRSNYTFTSCVQNDVNGKPFQYYPQAKRRGEVLNYTQTGGFFTINDQTREMWVAPILPRGTNDVTDWFDTGDGDHTVGSAIVLNSNLDVDMGGVPKLGTLTAITLEIKASGSYDYEVFYNAVSKASGSATNDKSITLTAADHTDDWAFELYHVEIDGTGAATINEIYLKLSYDDQQTLDRQSLTIYQAITGFEDLTAYYNSDGASNPVITSSGAPLENPAHVIEAVMRAKVLMNLSTDVVDLTALDTAATDRTGWKFAFSLDQPVHIAWLNEFCFESGMHVFKSFEGKWKVVAQEKSRVPAHTFLGDVNMAVLNPLDKPSKWEYDFTVARTPNRDLINEVILRYGLDRATGEYTKIKVASGRHRVKGTCTVTGSTKLLDDASATFVTDGIKDDEGVYVEGDQDYLVDNVNSETQLLIKHASAGQVNDSSAGTNYYVGPNLDGRMKRSQLRYKTENSLGREQTEDVSVAGGYTSDLIQDDTTATNFVDHIAEWRSQRRLLPEFATFFNAVDVELGDAAWIDHPWLPPSKRPIAIGTLSATQTAGAGTAQSTNNGLLRVNDYVLIGSEVEKVTAVTYATNAFTTTRAQANTSAAEHASGTTFYRLNRTAFEITGLQPDVELAQLRIEAQEMPPSYKPIGRVSAAGYDVYGVADADERTQSGWVTLTSERVQEEDEYSNISYVGPSS